MIPEVDVYMAVQLVNEGGHGEHYVVEAGSFDLAVETDFAFLIYRTGTERGLEAARQAQDQVEADVLNFGDYRLPNYDFEEVERWTARFTAEAQGQPLHYAFPRTSADITDRHQWNLETANGWGGSSPEVGVANMYANSALLSADECRSATFEDPESRHFTSDTAYDRDRYLIADVENVNSHRWTANEDGSITGSFNCGDDAPNNIDTRGHGFSFTMRYYGVSQSVSRAPGQPPSEGPASTPSHTGSSRPHWTSRNMSEGHDQPQGTHSAGTAVGVKQQSGVVPQAE